MNREGASMLSPRWLIVALMMTSTAVDVRGNDAPAGDITVLPTSITINHHRHPHSIQVLGASSDGFSLDLRPQATIRSGDAAVVRVDADGWIHPVGDGKTTVTVTVAGQTKTVAVAVSLPADEPAMSFRHEVMPVLSRAGCNMGACHGYSLGKNGFKLSLRGSDPDQDFFAITRDASGRRILPLVADASVLAGKARGDVPHEGGVRIRKGSLSDAILLSWIRQGVPSDLADKAEVVSVQMIPEKLILRSGQKHRLQLLARYTDGTVRDVTRLGIFSANSPQFADVDDEGLVAAAGEGETAIIGRFERTFAATNVVSLAPRPGFTPTPLPKDHVVDAPVIRKLNSLGVTPSALADDEEFLRRVCLDVIGVQPTPDEVRAFLADKNPRKREKLIDSLFERPEFVDYWSLKWGDLLQNSRSTTSAPGVYLFREFLRSAVASNMPVDEFARRILTARGAAHDDPASVYLASSKDTNETLERVTQTFCGVRMLCARCHAHPLENWTQADYFGLASFFTQVTTRVDTRVEKASNARIVDVNVQAAAAMNPRTGKPQPPRFLGGGDAKIAPAEDRRVAYARWLTAPENPFFARGFVNRVWSYFFHRGIIEPVDDIRSTNPPINPELLDALTKDFIASKFDMRHLIRRIVSSETYQRSSLTNESNARDEQNFSHALPRRIPAEAMLDSFLQATGLQEDFAGVPRGFRAAQLPDGNVDHAFLKLFGKPARRDACECERDNGSNMLQALHFINNKTLLARLQNSGARPAQLVAKKLDDEKLAIELYLWAVARHPNPKELEVSVAFLKSHAQRRLEAAQDLMWALLNSRDFLLTH